MKSCPACTFLIDDDADDCQFCGADSRGAQVEVDAAAGDSPSPHRETISTKVTAGVIVAASLSVLGVGAWALHRSPPPANSTRTVATAPAQVTYRSVTVTSSGPAYSIDVPIGGTEPDLSNGVRADYTKARELDVVRIPSTGGVDLPTMLNTFSSGWPTTDVASVTTAAGAGLSFVLSNDSSLTHGTLIDAGSNGVFLVAVKAPKGSTFTGLDAAVLKRAVATLKAA